MIPRLGFSGSHLEWSEIWHADLSWPPWELIRFWSSSVDFPHFAGRHFDLVKQAKFAIFGHFLDNISEEWPLIWHVGVFWPYSKQITFWSRSVDIPHFDAILTWWNRSNLGFLENRGEKWRVDVFWPISEETRFWSQHYGIWCWSLLALEWTPSQSIVFSLYSIVGVGGDRTTAKY